jgi:Ca-activated chloride channel family protein
VLIAGLAWGAATPAQEDSAPVVPAADGEMVAAASSEQAEEAAEPLSDEERIAALAPEFREWLERVSILITDEELDYFLTLEEDFRRWAFIEEFWRVRDPDPKTPYNELQRRWEARVGQALRSFGSLEDARARMLLTNGEPGRFQLPNGRTVARCFDRSFHTEIWFYGGSERTAGRFIVIFYQPDFGNQGLYELWYGLRDIRARRRFQLPSTDPSDFCEADLMVGAMRFIRQDTGYGHRIDELMEIPPPTSREWVATFAQNTTELPAGVETFEIELLLDYPGRNQHRTAVEGVVGIDPASVASVELAGQSVHRFLLQGEVIRDGRLLESFRYRFEVPAGAQVDNKIPLVFQRYLRPGEVDLRLRVEDILGQRYAQVRRHVEIPSPDGLDSVRHAPEAAIFKLLAEANEAAERGQTTIRIVPPPDGEVQMGGTRFQTVAVGNVDSVTFFLDGRPILTKRRPPYSVELNLGSYAATHRLRVVAYGPEGSETAADELLVNRGGQRFRVRLTEPRQDRKYTGSLSAVAEVEVPDGRLLDRVELYLDERQVATLYQPPFVQPILLEDDGLAYVRAVAFLADGLSTEDVVFVNAPEYFEEVEVVYVELYASVYDRAGRPVAGLEREEFTVLEDGVEQQLRRFEFVRDLPFHAALMIDTSSSMEGAIGGVVSAARGFVEQALRPRDRVALFSFNARPEVEVQFSSSPEEVAQALSTLRGRGTTALYDSLIFTLQYFDGIKGQKALLLLSDGQDEASRFDFAAALETAKRAGVTIYVVGLAELARDRDSQKILQTLAGETGGRSFFIEDPAELPAIYQTIQEELRSQYLLTYQSTSEKDEGEFRRIRVEVERDGVEVRTLAGYYP